jgi:hypothetical protein
MGNMRESEEMSDDEIFGFFEKEGRLSEKHGYVRRVADTIETDFPGQSGAWYAQCLSLASEMSCVLCGQNPCGEETTVGLIRHGPTGTVFMGVCPKCAASTAGQNGLRIFYRAWVAMINHGVKNKYRYHIINGMLCSIDQPNVMP